MFIYYVKVSNSLFDNLPTIFKSRFSAFKQFDWNGYFKNNRLVFLISTLIGASSHIL
ncbi:DUF4184 family protein [Sphingobacterium corticibacterium]|uniref:DUF4184 family protein n=1 Tax=Sphingobacterium corticibacterium TaxID=2484746 RepID=UPI003743068F